MRKIREVIRLKQDRYASAREIALACHIGRTTVQEYLHRAEAAGLRWPLPEELSDAALERLLFPPGPIPDGPPRAVPDWPRVQTQLARKGVTLLLLWQEYKELFPEGYGYSRYASLYRQWKDQTDLSMLQRHKAGEKLFVDFAGLTMNVTDPAAGEIRKVQVFASAMGASQRIFAKAYESQDLRSWLLANSEAFEFYGALPEILVPDNLKAGVTAADRYEPALNPSFAEFARHYGVAVIPARPLKPKDKAKVENAVQQVERWVLAPLRDRLFFSLDELNEAIGLKLADLDGRLMKGPNLCRKELFEQIDLPLMRPLPLERYAYAQWKRAKLGPDYHAEFEGHRYSAPYSLVGKQVDLRITVHTVEVFLGSQRIFGHVRSLLRRGFTTEPSHMPKVHQAHAEWTPERLEEWALKSGPSTAALVKELLQGKLHPQQGFRSCLGIISLQKRYSAPRLEAACARALGFGAISYRNVKTILEKGLDSEPPPLPVAQVPPVLHANVRGAAYFSEEVPCAN
jgi:transposase